MDINKIVGSIFIGLVSSAFIVPLFQAVSRAQQSARNNGFPLYSYNLIDIILLIVFVSILFGGLYMYRNLSN